MADEYIKLKGKNSPKKFENFSNYSSELKVVFLERLASDPNVSLDVIKKLDEDLKISHTKDPECKFRWLALTISKNYNLTLKIAEEFVSS